MARKLEPPCRGTGGIVSQPAQFLFDLHHADLWIVIRPTDEGCDLSSVSDSPQFSRVLEIFLVPGVVGALSVYAPIGTQAGLPVPLGLVSFDNRVVGRVQKYLASRAALYLRNTAMEAAAFEDLSRMKEPDSIT